MANYSLFKSKNDFVNEAGGKAYKMSPHAALAQLASTSCLNNTLYVSAERQLGDILLLSNQVLPEYIAKVALYSREKYHMRDIPALLCAVLAARHRTDLLKKIFPRVINNGDMLRNFFQMIRSGIAGRLSFGTASKRLIVNWFNARSPNEIFDQSIGNPSMRDILRCVRPRPLDRTRSNLYAWFVGRAFDLTLLPEKVKAFEDWKNAGGDLPPVDFRLLTSKPLTTEQYTTIAKRAGWKWLLKNLNNMIKNGVFLSEGMIDFVASRLSDRESIKKARAFPYQIMTAYQNAVGIPEKIKDALNKALEVATENVPIIPENKSGNCPVYLMVDVSKSMLHPVTGKRDMIDFRSNTKVKCVDVAALMACCILRKNKGSRLICFNTAVVDAPVDPSANVMDNALCIAKIANGGTACSAPLKMLNDAEMNGNLIIFCSDNQSWAESMGINRYGHPLTPKAGKTALQMEWERYKERNPEAKMVCLDAAPYITTQVQERPDVLNIGGFSDQCFNLIDQFVNDEMDSNKLVGLINAIDLDGAPLYNDKEEIEE